MINTHHQKLSFGKYRGELWTRIPISYLRWLLNECDKHSENFKMAEAEIKRRGTILERNIEISSHAVDRASLHCRKIWHDTAKSNSEGLYSWLVRMAEHAMEKGERKGDNYFFNGLRFVIEKGNYYPILKTIMPIKKAFQKR